MAGPLLHAADAPPSIDLLTPLVLPPSEKFTIDQVLEKWAGQFGPAQLLHFTLSSLAWTLNALLSLSMVFSDSTPKWTCITSTPTAGYHPHYGSMLQVPYPSNASVIVSGNSTCTSSSSICTMDTSEWMWIGGKSQSIVSEWDLLCGKEYMISWVQCVFFVGGLLGAGIYGSLSDSFLGRKGVLTLTCCLSSVCSVLTALSPNYWTYFLLRAATGLNCGGMGLSCFVLSTEAVGPAKRGPVAMSAFYFFSGGIIMLSTFAYLTHSWRHLYLLISIPCFLYCFLVLPFLSESPRWYLTRGRAEDALAVMNQIAKRNGRSIPSGIQLDTEERNPDNQTVLIQKDSTHIQSALEDPSILIHCPCSIRKPHVQILSCVNYSPNETLHNPQAQVDVLDNLNDLQTDAELEIPDEIPSALQNHEDDPVTYARNASNQTLQQHEGAEIEPSTATILDIFRHPTTRTRMVIMICIWLEMSIVYYGINLNASNIGSSLYLSIALNAVAELPALAATAILLNKVGRKPMLVIAMLVTGVSCSMGALISVGAKEGTSVGTNGKMACGVLAIFGVAAGYNLIYIYTAELFPTEVRNAALGLASQAGQVGAIVSPVTALLGKRYPSLPFSMMGGVMLVGCLFVTLKLPETHNIPTFETLHGMRLSLT